MLGFAGLGQAATVTLEFTDAGGGVAATYTESGYVIRSNNGANAMSQSGFHLLMGSTEQ